MRCLELGKENSALCRRLPGAPSRLCEPSAGNHGTGPLWGKGLRAARRGAGLGVRRPRKAIPSDGRFGARGRCEDESGRHNRRTADGPAGRGASGAAALAEENRRTAQEGLRTLARSGRAAPQARGALCPPRDHRAARKAGRRPAAVAYGMREARAGGGGGARPVSAASAPAG